MVEASRGSCWRSKGNVQGEEEKKGNGGGFLAEDTPNGPWLNIRWLRTPFGVKVRILTCVRLNCHLNVAIANYRLARPT